MLGFVPKDSVHGGDIVHPYDDTGIQRVAWGLIIFLSSFSMAVLTTLAALFRCIAECCTLAHAQLIDSTSILAVDRRVQEIDAAKDHGMRTFENEEFLEQMMVTCSRVAFQIFAPKL